MRLPCPKLRLWQNFHEDLISILYTKLLMDKQRDKRWESNFFDGGNNICSKTEHLNIFTVSC